MPPPRACALLPSRGAPRPHRGPGPRRRRRCSSGPVPPSLPARSARRRLATGPRALVPGLGRAHGSRELLEPSRHPLGRRRGSELPVLLPVGFSEPVLGKFPVVTTPRHSQQPALSRFYLGLGQISHCCPATQKLFSWERPGLPANSREVANFGFYCTFCGLCGFIALVFPIYRALQPCCWHRGLHKGQAASVIFPVPLKYSQSPCGDST